METSSKIVGKALGGLGSLVTAPLRMYLTQLVRDQLAHYLREDCVDLERLTLDGTFTLQNIELKLDVLRDTLGVPHTLKITRAFIRTLQVNVPWTNLVGQPITVKIDTVMIVLRLKTDEELRKTAAAATAATAATAAAANDSANSASTTNSSNNSQQQTEQNDAPEEGWIASLVKRVVANTSLKVKDLIFKFDDGEGRVLTATLNSLNIFSADPRNRWSVSSFFEPEGDQKRVCKAAALNGLSIRLDRSTKIEEKMNGSMKGNNGSSYRQKKRKQEHEVPVLRRANISVRGWFSLAPVYVDERNNDKDEYGKEKGKGNNDKDPFFGYSGWHNGREEVRGHPATVLDIHCTRLRFALSETQVDTILKISDRVSRATSILQEAAFMVNEQNRVNDYSKTLTTIKKNVMTTDDVKAMLNAATFKAQHEEREKKTIERNERLLRQKQDEQQQQEEDDDEGVVSGLLSWAWNSLVGDDEYEEDAENDESRNVSKLIRSFRVIGLRFDHIGLDFLLHVRGHKLNDRGPLHLRYPFSVTPSIATTTSIATTSAMTTQKTAIQSCRRSSETATEDEEDIKNSVFISPERSAQARLSSGSTNTNIVTPSSQNIVKVRTPGGFVEVDMSDNINNKSYCGGDQYETTRDSLSGNTRTSSVSTSSSSPSTSYVSRERYHARHSRERVEAFASLHFSGIEYETRTHTIEIMEQNSNSNKKGSNIDNTRDSKQIDYLSLFEIRSIGMWSTTEMTRSVEVSNGRHVTLPNYLLLCGECALHDFDDASRGGHTRLSSLSNASLSPPPSPALFPLLSPRTSGGFSQHNGPTPPPMRLSSGSIGLSSASRTNRSMLNAPSPITPNSTPNSSSTSNPSFTSSSSRRSSTAWLEWVAQPFLPRRIGLNLPPPQDDLPSVDEVIKSINVAAQGRAFRMAKVDHSIICGDCMEAESGRRGGGEEKTSIAIGHCTARLDPEWIADMRVMMNMKNNDDNKKKEGKKDNDGPEEMKKPTDCGTESTMNISIEGLGMWMVLEAPSHSIEAKPSWCLLESTNINSSSSSFASSTSTNNPAWSYTFENICLCTGTLTPSIGETGFRRGLAAQLANTQICQNIFDTPKYWQLQSTGLFRTDCNSQLHVNEVRANKWPTYTLSSTNDGAPILSTRADVVVVQNIFAASTNENYLQIQKGGHWHINLNATHLPFLTACYAALTDKSVVEDDMLYWIRIAENLAQTSSTSDKKGHVAQNQKPTPLEEEVVRLRVLLHEAREEAERWKAVVENGLSA